MTDLNFLQKFTEHGGNVYYYAKNLKLSPFEIIDLSSSANPLIKKFLKINSKKLLNILEFYPDPEGEDLKEVLSKTYGIDKKSIVIGNGSYELLQGLILILPERTKFFLPEPTFVGYRKILKLKEKSKIYTHFSLNPEEHLEAIEKFLKKESKGKAVIICHPNNPTGLVFNKEALSTLISKYEETFFIIDEAFIDFVEEESLISQTKTHENLFILRSLSKFYGLAGVRIGYLVTLNPLLSKVKTLVPTWSANTLSQYLARELLLNQEFKKRSLKYFQNLKTLFEKALKEMEVNFLPSYTNFYLLRHLPGGKNFFFWLLKEKHILIRPCFNFHGLTEGDFRVSLKDEKSLKLFIGALREWLKAL